MRKRPVKRLLRDQELLRERIGHKQVMSLGTFLTMLDRDGMADFLIIYGKAAREGIADSNECGLLLRGGADSR
jgi:hypothetical protein